MNRAFLALDGMSILPAVDFVQKLANMIRFPKIHDLYDAEGPRAAQALYEAGASGVWVDYKLHDTKDTVALRVKALVKNGARMITVHASGGVEMMQAAVEAARYPWGREGTPRAEIWAITVLTSLNPTEIARIYGRDRTPPQIVFDLALMAKEAGVHGVVCSAQEVGMLSKHPKLTGLEFIVPGTRSAGAALGQQKRSGTPEQAMADGADYLVAGSQVTKSADHIGALDAFNAEIEGGIALRNSNR